MPHEERWTRATENLVAQAIGDPGSFLPRGNDYQESIPRWGMRAVLGALADAGILLPINARGRVSGECLMMPLEERLQRGFSRVPEGSLAQNYVNVAINMVAGWLYEHADVLRARSVEEEVTDPEEAKVLSDWSERLARLGRDIVAGEEKRIQ